MKKVLILAAALSLFAAPAFAGISGTAHDLSNGYNSTTPTNTEICVYCHTPHGADTTIANAPLWNRSSATATVTGVYNGLDIQATFNAATVNATDALLCLSCHDGATNMDALNNPPNTGTVASTVMNAAATNPAVLSADLSDDHPIGFNYDTVAGLDDEIDTMANATTVGKVGFFGVDSNEMWCSSCHDVHDDTTASPFLNTTNSGSQLCLACHIK